MKKRLNLRELLNFYDYKVASSTGHATAVNAVLGEDLAVALLEHYFRSQGHEVRVLDVTPTQGTQKGYRLDKWIVVVTASDSTIYQVEIKNWSAHSIGGREVKLDSDEDYMSDFRRRRWNHQFDQANIPTQKETRKVLTRMRAPSGYSDFTQKSMLCFWEPIHPEGKSIPFFSVVLNGEAFDELGVFSMSNYVSLLRQETEYLEVEMKDADARIEWLQKLYGA